MKVRIKEWADMAEQYGLDEDGDINCYCSFTTDMKEYCGKVFEVYDTDDWKGFEYDGWLFSSDTYEIIEE